MGYQRKNGVDLGQVYMIATDHDISRVAYDHAKKVKIGDVAMVTRHTGDCHFSYHLLDRDERGVYTKRSDGAFSAYVMGRLHEEQPTDIEYHKIMANMGTVFSTKIDVAEEEKRWRARADEELGGMVERAVGRMAADQSRMDMDQGADDTMRMGWDRDG